LIPKKAAKFMSDSKVFKERFRGKVMKSEFEELITEGEEHVTFIHRTDSASVPGIFKRGLVCGADIRTTATRQPMEYAQAEGLFNSGRAHGNTVVVIQIPIQTWRNAHQFLPGEEVIDDQIGYVIPGEDIAVKPGYVIAAIDRDSRAVRYNPIGWRRCDGSH
jgi:hypothetical protein